MTSTPRLTVPAGACDSHIHIYGDPERFAYVPYAGVSKPAHFVDEYLAVQALLGLLAGGKCWVKLSAPYQLSRSGAPNYDDFRVQARALVDAAPHRMVWGTNWPHPKVDWHPDEAALLDVLQQWCPDRETVNAILVDNPAQLYGFADSD